MISRLTIRDVIGSRDNKKLLLLNKHTAKELLTKCKELNIDLPNALFDIGNYVEDDRVYQIKGNAMYMIMCMYRNAMYPLYTFNSLRRLLGFVEHKQHGFKADVMIIDEFVGGKE